LTAIVDFLHSKLIAMLNRRKFLEDCNRAYAQLKANPKNWRAELAERKAWDTTLADGLEIGSRRPERADSQGGALDRDALAKPVAPSRRHLSADTLQAGSTIRFWGGVCL
jgi:hypothetical protein